MVRILVLLAVCCAVVAPGAAADQSRFFENPAASGDVPIALLFDVQSGQTLYAVNPTRRFIPASITKVMTAFVAFELITANQLDLTQQFVMSEAVADEWYRTGSTMFLEPQESVSVDTLLKGITAVSANDASVVLAEGALGSVDAWVARMNETARELGMLDSHFGTPNGWPDSGKTFTTARDLQILAQALIARHPALYTRYFGQPGLRHNGIAQANHDPITGFIDGADGLKTGFTNQAGHGFLGSAERGGTRLIMVVGAAENRFDRAQTARELIEWGFSHFDRRALFDKDAIVAKARVQDGMSDTVLLAASQRITAATPRGDKRMTTLSITYDGPIAAPISAGENVATLHISVEGMPPARVPLVAAGDIAQAGFMTRISNAFSRRLR